MKSDPILATAFANADGGQQGQMLNAIARELFVLCRGQAGFESQVYYMCKELDKDGEAFILELARFIELRREEINQ